MEKDVKNFKAFKSLLNQMQKNADKNVIEAMKRKDNPDYEYNRLKTVEDYWFKLGMLAMIQSINDLSKDYS